MRELELLLRRLLRGAWRHRWWGVGVAWIICLAGWALVLKMPPRYQASAQLYVAADPVLTPLLHGIAIGGNSQAEFELLRETLLSKPNLKHMINATGLTPNQTGPDAEGQLIKKLQANVRVRAQSGKLFTIAYTSTAPKQAFTVVQGLVNLYVERTSAHNQGDMNNARSFLDSQIAYFHARLKKLEKRRANFESKYLQLLPGAGGVSQYETAQSSLTQLQGALQDEQARKAMIMSQLSHTKPVLSAEQVAGNAGQGLAAAEAHLAQLRQTFTNSYPGVIAAEKEVQRLRATASGKTSGAGAVVANPVYEKLHLQLLDTGAKLFSLRRQIAQTKAEVNKLGRIARSQPGLKAEYVNLNRNYGALTAEYDDLIKRREAMRIGAAADVDANQVQLQVVNPPEVPRLPSGPHRRIFFLGVLIVALGAAVALPMLVAELEGCFESLDELRRFGLPVLGAITEAGRRARPLRAALGVGLATAPLLVLLGALLIAGAAISGLA